MADITITFSAKNLARGETEKLQRDIMNLKRRFEEADKSAKGFGQRLGTIRSQLQGLTRLVSKGKVVTQDLQQITDHAPQVTQALQNIFNTTQADAAIQQQLEASGQNVKDFVNGLNSRGAAITAYHALSAAKRDAAAAAKELEAAQKKELKTFEQAAKQETPEQSILALRIEGTTQNLVDARKELAGSEQQLRVLPRTIPGKRSGANSTKVGQLKSDIENQKRIIEDLERTQDNLNRSRLKTGIQLPADALRYLKTSREQLGVKVHELQVEKAIIKERETRSGKSGIRKRAQKAADFRKKEAEIQIKSTESSIVAIQKTKTEESEKQLDAVSKKLAALTMVKTRVKSTLQISTEIQELLKAQTSQSKQIEKTSKNIVRNRKSELELHKDSFVVLNDLNDAGTKLKAPASAVDIPRTPIQGVRPDVPVPERDVYGNQNDPDNRRATGQRPAADVRENFFEATQQQQVENRPAPVNQQAPTQRELPSHIQSIVDTLSNVPSDTLSAAYDALIEIPAQTREVLQQLKMDTQQNILEIKNSEVLSAREKAAEITEIEKNAAKRRKEIEKEASQAKIDAFSKVVENFIGGIGRMIAEQVKLRAATALTNALLGTPGQGSGSGGLLGSALPFLGAVNPVLAVGGGLALGAAALFSSSFDDPINDALARQAGLRQAQQRAARSATVLGRRSAVDLRDNFEQGFVSETARQTSAPRGDAGPVIMNEIKLVIGGQELKAIYEETQRQITTGVIAR